MREPPARLAVFASFSGTGGVERMLVNLIRGFVDLGQTVDLVTVRTESPHLDRLPDSVRLITLNHDHTLLAAPTLARYLRQQRPAALLAAKDRGGRAAAMAQMLARTDTRIVLRLGTNLSRSMAERMAVERWMRFLPIRLLYPRLDRVVAVSQGVAEDTARIAHLPPQSICVIRNPVITPELPELAAAPCPHPWLAPDAPPLILAAGRLQRQKDFPTLIQAFAQLSQWRPDCRLMILGEGMARTRLVALIARLGLTDRVALPGFQQNPYAFLARARLFVLSSAWEGSPNVLTEAMALGVPVVATDCPSGPREILDGGRYGPLVPVGDASALAVAMRETLEHPLAAQVLQDAVGEYTQAESARRYLEVLGLG